MARGRARPAAFDAPEHIRGVVRQLKAREGMTSRELRRRLAELNPPIIMSEAAMSDRLRPTWTDPSRPQPPFTVVELYGIIRVFGADPNIFFAPADLMILPGPPAAAQRSHRGIRNNIDYYGSSDTLVAGPVTTPALT